MSATPAPRRVRTGGIVLGPPVSEAGDGAAQHLWWDYDLVARRALGLKDLSALWPRDWSAVVTATLGAVAVSRLAYVAVLDAKKLIDHPYVRTQMSFGRVAVFTGGITPRHGSTRRDVANTNEALISLAAEHKLPTLATLEDVRAWTPARERG